MDVSPMRVGTRIAIAVLILAVCAAAVAAPDGAAVTITGTVGSVKASERTVTVKLTDGGESTFVWSSDTRITGVLTPGARVTVRYVPADGGPHKALQITVARG
jgi:P pilus assembly chaperone PapD